MNWNLRREEEEAIYRKKLLYDNQGVGEDRRLISILKNITKLSLSEDSKDESTKLVNTISRDLINAINSAERQEKVSQMCDTTLENLEKLIEEQSHQIEILKTGLSNLELELEFSERLKRVNSLPECQKTFRAMQEIDIKKQSLLIRIERQKSNLQSLIEACRNLKKVLDDEDGPNDSNDIIILQ